jgi:hypothetical protein
MTVMNIPDRRSDLRVEARARSVAASPFISLSGKAAASHEMNTHCDLSRNHNQTLRGVVEDGLGERAVVLVDAAQLALEVPVRTWG